MTTTSSPRMRKISGSVYAIMHLWPTKPKHIARHLIETYGFPDEMTDHHLIWKRAAPDRRTIVCEVRPAPVSHKSRRAVAHVLIGQEQYALAR